MSSGQFPIAVASRPPSTALVSRRSLLLSSSLLASSPSGARARARARVYRGGSCAGNYVARDRNAGRKSQFISFQPRWTPRADRRSRSPCLPPRSPPLFLLALSGPLMTLENRSSRSPAHCHSSLSHASLIARYLSRRRLFTRRPGVFDGRRLRAGPISFVAAARNRNLPARVINYVARRPE